MTHVESTESDIRLVADGLHRSYGRQAVLRGVTFEARRGEIVGLVGENGSGKSTLLRVLAGLERPDRGAVARRGRLGYCPQEPLVFERLSVRENLAYFAAALGLARWRDDAGEALERLRLDPEDRRLVAELSGGTRQKLNLLVALMCRPEILLLDEPYAAFDWETYLAFWGIARGLREGGCTLLLVSHLVYDQSQLDRLLHLDAGRIACA